MKRPMRSSKLYVQEEGAALLEFVFCLPLFLVVVYGLLSLTALVRGRYQVVLVAHAVMREAVTGAEPEALNALARAYARAAGAYQLKHLSVSVESASDPLARAPVRSARGMSRMSRYLAVAEARDRDRQLALNRPSHPHPEDARVAVKPKIPPLIAKLAAGSRVRVRALVPVSGPLRRLWPGGLPVEYSSVYLLNPWKGSIISKVKQLFRQFTGG